MKGDTTDDKQGESRDGSEGWPTPSRRAVLGGIGGAAAAGLTVGQVGAQFGPTGPATPTVEGPIEGGSQTGRPMTAAPHDFESAGYVEEEYFISGTAEQLGSGGLLGSIGGGSSGLGGTSGSSGSSGSDSGPAEYKTRVLVYRPENEADFNGNVLVEWFNVSLQTDFPVAWPNAYEYLQRNGWAVALVSAQKVGVDNSSEDLDLVTWDPERYGSLHHPGDSYALDIFAQAIQSLRQGSDGSTTGGSSGSGGSWFGSGSGGSSDSGGGWFGSGGSSSTGGSGGGWLGANLQLGQIGGSGGLWGSDGSSGSSSGGSGGWFGSGGSGGTSGGGSGGTGGGSDDPHPLGGYDVANVIATGQSQSSFYISSFISDVEPDYDIVDGFLPAAGFPDVPTDVDPTIFLNTMSEAGGNLLEGAGEDLPGNTTAPDIPPEVIESLLGGGPPADEGQFRFWEVAGAVHVNQWLSRWSGAARRRDFGTDDPAWDPQEAANYGELEEGNYGECDYNYFPMRYVYSAAIESLRAWIEEGTAAPSAPRMERTETEDGSTQLVRDEYGNAVGGIRLGPVEAPVATYEAADCGLTGKTTRFDQSQLDSLYSSHGEYVSQFETATQQAVQDGFLLQADAQDLVERAQASPIGR